jgi:ABC-type phosphate transport system substrate-binding protein
VGSKRRGLLVWIIIGAIAIAGIGIMLPVLMRIPEPPDEPSNNTKNGANNTKIEKPAIHILSVRSAFPFVDRWVAQYNNDDQARAIVTVSYLEEASIGLDELALIDSGGIAKNGKNNSYYVPVSAQAIAIVYNVPGFPDIPSGLRLDADTLFLILNGTITHWNDPAIEMLNKDLNLPDEKLRVVHERVNGSLDLIIRSPSNFTWPIDSIEASGPDELAATVRKTPYSIGYTDFSYAIQTKMTYAAMETRGGEYVVPSIDSIREAAETGLELRNNTDLDPTVLPPVINASKLGNSSYSLVGLYYIAIGSNTVNYTGVSQTDNTTHNIKRDATLDLVRWIISDKGQQTLSEVGYPALYRDNLPLRTYADKIISYSYNASEQDGSTQLVA